MPETRPAGSPADMPENSPGNAPESAPGNAPGNPPRNPPGRAPAAPLAGSYLRALLPKPSRRGVPGGWSTPASSRENITVDPEHLRRYRHLCGFAGGPTLPPTYPHLTAFPMAMALITRRSFPYRALGLVHIRNEICQTRPIGEHEHLDYHVWVDKPVEHPKGIAFDVRAEVSDSVGNLVWISTSTYLRRTSSAPMPPTPATSTTYTTPTTPATQTWPLPADLGRRYASLSGDRNPIHLYPWTARAFGFPRQIAHGMWTAARCVAAIDAPQFQARTDPAAVLTVTVDFRAPVPLPSTVVLTHHPAAAGPIASSATDFTLVSVRTGRTHLTGRLRLA